MATKAIFIKDGARGRDTLAAAYAEDKQFDKAVATEKRAIEMLRNEGLVDKVPDFETRLELYKKRQPYRKPRTK